MAGRAMAIEWELPADLLLEIAARSDFRTLIRCAASCKLLRRDILSPFFIRRVTRHDGIVPPCILAYLLTNDLLKVTPPPPPLTLVHPTTPAAMSFSDHHLSPFMSRNAGDLLRDYSPRPSRGGLVLLLRCRHVSISRPDLCVYDPVTGHRSFLSEPPGIPDDTLSLRKCVSLTAADGIGCSFMLFVGDLDWSSGARSGTPRVVKVQTFKSSDCAWGPVVSHEDLVPLRWASTPHDGGKILSYDVRTTEITTMKLPIRGEQFRENELQLGSYSSSDGRVLLRLLAIVGCTISVWHHSARGWDLEIMIDFEEKLRPLNPGVPHVRFGLSTERSSTVLLDLVFSCRVGQTSSLPALLDLETTPSSTLLEIDLPSRLRAMKIFS
ncbi:hypothetical protein VPH35_119641 [Triticum aestivum]